MLTLLSCNHQDLPENNPDITPDRKNLHLVEIKNESFFSTSNLRFDFAEIDEDIYLNYMPDGMNTTKWILLSENEAGISATIVWSEDIREIGKTENNIKIYLNGSVPCFESEFFGVQRLALNEGVEASRFDPEKVPPLKSEYLSNFSGKYNLENHKYELTIGAKLGLSESVNSYWNANVLNTVYDEDTKTYDLILAHSSQNNSSGSISPGITGNEPFITKQGLFWSHLTLTAEPGSIWKIKWSSVWYESPYEAINADMDCTDSFIGPETTKITYRYNFYFGTPKLKESGYGVEAEGEELLGTYTEESAVAKNITWADVKNLIPSYQLPENKLADYWWYNTDSLSPIIESSVFKVSDTTVLGLYEYDFYLALKDKPEDKGGIPSGNYKYEKPDTGFTQLLIITDTSISYKNNTDPDFTEYTIIDKIVWTETESFLSVGYLTEDPSGEKVIVQLYYYINKQTVKFRKNKSTYTVPESLPESAPVNKDMTNYSNEMAKL